MKKLNGQFFTTNYNTIFKNFNIPANETNIIEPFAGDKDLVKFINKENIEMYDIEPKYEDIVYRDCLIDVPDYENKFVITNPVVSSYRL